MDLREVGLSPLLKVPFAISLMMVAFLSVSAQADSPKKHRGPCEIHYPTHTLVSQSKCRDGSRIWRSLLRYHSSIRLERLEEEFILIDLTEQFLGAYEFGALRFSTPIASGNGLNKTPTGGFV
jgi:hypothetical protein